MSANRGGYVTYRWLHTSLVVVAMFAGRALADAPSPAAVAFPLADVRLTDPSLLAARQVNADYLLHFDVDRILWLFRRQAGLPHPGEPLHGWEHPGAGAPGMFHGHYLSACATMYQATRDPIWKERVAQLVAGLAECQQSNGYLSTFPERAFDHIETTPRDGSIPYYTIHKVMAGLFDAYDLCGNVQALDVLERMSNYFAARCAKLSSDQRRDNVLPREFGGMNEVAWNLYAVRPSEATRGLAIFFDQEDLYGSLAQGEDNLRDRHANTYVPKVIGAARRFELTGEERYHDVAEFFWKTVVTGRSFVTGGTCVGEHWRGEPGQLAGQLAYNDQETCVTYNMLKSTRHLFAWQPRAALFDYYERAFYNSILGSQDPATGAKLYHLSLKPGGYKLFGDPENSLWCCFGTGVENFARIGDSVYFHSPDNATLWVNLFMASELTWNEQHVVIEQTTRFPAEGETTLTVRGETAATFAMRVRLPAWTSGVTFSINDSAFAAAQRREDGYLEVRRTWQPGDRLRVRLPMSVRVEAMPDDANLVALMYGPIVLAGQLSEPLAVVDRTVPGRFPFQELMYEQGSVPVPAIVAADNAALVRRARPVTGEALAFTLPTTAGDVSLRPLSETIDRHYTVYWRRFAPGTPALAAWTQRDAAERARAKVTIDAVDVGEFVSEVVHAFKGDKSDSGTMDDSRWRDAAAGGSFSYRLRVDADGPTALDCTYFGDERVPRTFQILVDDTVIATQRLGPGRATLFDKRYPIPRELTAAKRAVTITFRGVDDSIAGGVFRVATVRP